MEKSRGTLIVCDISVTGMKIKVKASHSFSVGDLLKVEFRLDDYKKTLILKNVLIRNMNLLFIGTEFPINEEVGKDLGFYLFN